ncbi:hypothetical protein RDWZM_003155, partial [Blomia tropicalis]
ESKRRMGRRITLNYNTRQSRREWVVEGVQDNNQPKDDEEEEEEAKPKRTGNKNTIGRYRRA